MSDVQEQGRTKHEEYEVSTVGGMAPVDSGITLRRDDEGLSIDEVGLGGVNQRTRVLEDELDDFRVGINEVLGPTELQGEAANTVATLRGEADELQARDDVDDHMQDVIDGLRHQADELAQQLEALGYHV